MSFGMDLRFGVSEKKKSCVKRNNQRKHRLYKPIRMKDRVETFHRLMREQENLNILSRPYLTVEEERGHVKAMGRDRLAYEAMKIEQQSKMLPHRTIEEHLEHVNTGRRWE